MVPGVSTVNICTHIYIYSINISLYHHQNGFGSPFAAPFGPALAAWSILFGLPSWVHVAVYINKHKHTHTDIIYYIYIYIIYIQYIYICIYVCVYLPISRWINHCKPSCLLGMLGLSNVLAMLRCGEVWNDRSTRTLRRFLLQVRHLPVPSRRTRAPIIWR